MQHTIRNVISTDIDGLKAVLDSSELFPSEFLDDMIADYLTNPDSEDIWFAALDEGTPVAIGYCAPEKLTEGTYNLYAIAVRKELQGKGLGGEMMRYIEDVLRQKSARILIVETSGDAQFDLTRQFYLKLGYTHEATIREFWNTGEDKVIFWKKL